MTSSKFHFLSAGAVWVSVNATWWEAIIFFLPNFIRLISGPPALTPSASTQTFLSLFLKTENQQWSLFSFPHTGPKKTPLLIAAAPGAVLYWGVSSSQETGFFEVIFWLPGWIGESGLGLKSGQSNPHIACQSLRSRPKRVLN